MTIAELHELADMLRHDAVKSTKLRALPWAKIAEMHKLADDFRQMATDKYVAQFAK